MLPEYLFGGPWAPIWAPRARVWRPLGLHLESHGTPVAPFRDEMAPQKRPKRYSGDRCCLNIFLVILGALSGGPRAPRAPCLKALGSPSGVPWDPRRPIWRRNGVQKTSKKIFRRQVLPEYLFGDPWAPVWRPPGPPGPRLKTKWWQKLVQKTIHGAGGA